MHNTDQKIQVQEKPNIHHQNGAILILVLIVLSILVTSSTQFFSVATDSTKISGASRDNAESLLLTESAMEMLRGQFINDLDFDGDTTVVACEISGVSLDKCEADNIRNNLDSPLNSLMSYMYYVSDATALNQTSPSILQKVANGEGAFNTASANLGTQLISSATTELRVGNLFGDTFKPLLFTLNTNGLLINSVAANWDAETGTHKAAAWMEVTLNPDDGTAIDLYVQAVAQVGSARSFIQRYVGTYYENDTLGGLVSPLAESSNIDRGP